MFVEILALMLSPPPEEVDSLKSPSVLSHICRGNEFHKSLQRAGVSGAGASEHPAHFQALGQGASPTNMPGTMHLFVLVF